ncbi:hypothetical protein BO71DRAFT_288306, partial [Aspergillus ellipticus CBS 707.79]
TARRSKAMPTDGPTPRFLYTIIKQLDLKSIDWNLVASQLEISNGHAARMRYSRFRQQMEGLTSKPRAPRPKKPANKNPKAGASKAELMEERVLSPLPPVMKQESHYSAHESNPYIKTDPYGHGIPSLADIPVALPHGLPVPMPQLQRVPYTLMATSSGEPTMFAPVPAFQAEHFREPGCPVSAGWAPIKSEP